MFNAILLDQFEGKTRARLDAIDEARLPPVTSPSTSSTRV